MDSKLLIDNIFDQLVNSLQLVMRYDTTMSQPFDGAPFGIGNRQCLDYVLKLGGELGFETYNCDGYAGHIDFVGKGHGIVGILGHLDVVPASDDDGWIHPAFSATIADGKLYGRGASDDKGPMIACLYALKALKDSGFVPNKTIRLIFGCDEESGMRCMEYYFANVDRPDIAFSPDGDFPVINREKGIYQHIIHCGAIDDRILSITAGTRINVVPNTATAIVKGTDYAVAQDGVDVTVANGTTIITTYGRNAHASTPKEGANATWQLFAILSQMFGNDKTLQYISDRLCDYTGKSWGLQLKDSESGELTCNIGTVSYIDNNLQLGMDIRFPVTYSCAHIADMIAHNTPYSVVIDHAKEPLYVAEDSFLVSTLLNVFNDVCDCALRPLAIGGGTYSRCLPNCVAFGPLMPNEVQTIHMPNENVALDSLALMARLFLEAMYRLAQ